MCDDRERKREGKRGVLGAHAKEETKNISTYSIQHPPLLTKI